MKKTAIHVIPFLMFSSFSVYGATISSGYKVDDPLAVSNTLHPQQKISPLAGTTIVEPSFGLNLTRLTNAGSVSSRHEYSRFDPYNKDQSMIILNDNGGFSSVYNTQNYPYNEVANKVTSLYDYNDATQIRVREARWDRDDTNKIWGLSDASIKTVNLSSSTPVVTEVKNFSQDTNLTKKLGYTNFTITMKDEGESSYNKQHWAFLAKELNNSGSFTGKQHLFTWDKDNHATGNSGGTIGGVYELTGDEQNIDWVGMSPNGNHVLVGGLDYSADEASQNITGLTMATKNFDKFHRLDYITAHADVGLDSQNNEVIVMQNNRTDYVDMIPIDWNTKAIKVAGGSYDGTNRTRLIKLNYDDNSDDGFHGGVHISGNHNGYALISTNNAENVSEDNWLEKTILLVTLDSTKEFETEYLSKNYNSLGGSNGYWQETHGTITNDGTKVLWAANWDDVDLATDPYIANFLLQVEVAPVPVPGALLLMGSGLLGLAGFSRRRKS